jgi:hypothetical protein
MGLGSGIRKKPIPDPGSRGQKGTGSRIRIRNTGCPFHFMNYFFFRCRHNIWVWYRYPLGKPVIEAGLWVLLIRYPVPIDTVGDKVEYPGIGINLESEWLKLSPKDCTVIRSHTLETNMITLTR